MAANKVPLTVKVHKLKAKIAEHKEKIRLLEAKISYLQTICPHPPGKVKTSVSSDYKGGTDHYWSCSDCGLSKIT